MNKYKIGNQFFFNVYFVSKFYGELREPIWAKTKKEAKEKFIAKMGKMKVNRIEYIEEEN